ncbi:hypothetical protein HYY72_05155 [Candidatus Woesearchaeota archaeon]|nr:hypothetical protein [Candidatus Woesearchaeota archaeon]
MTARLLEVRKGIKSKKPVFLIQDFHRRKELPRKWRRPRGIHSKMRMRKAGHPRHVEIGYGSPKLVRHLDRNGKRRVLVSNTGQIGMIKVESEVAVISHGVGIRKRLEILKAAEQKGVKVVNSKQDALIKKLDSRKLARQKAEKEKLEKKKAIREKPQAIKRDEKEQHPEKSEEERAMEEKREKDRLLTKREI